MSITKYCLSCQREFEKKITMKNQGSAKCNQSKTSTDARPTAASLRVGDTVQVKTWSKYQDQQGTVIGKKNKIQVQFADGHICSVCMVGQQSFKNTNDAAILGTYATTTRQQGYYATYPDREHPWCLLHRPGIHTAYTQQPSADPISPHTIFKNSYAWKWQM